jgi:hypothetical protein
MKAKCRPTWTRLVKDFKWGALYCNEKIKLFGASSLVIFFVNLLRYLTII